MVMHPLFRSGLVVRLIAEQIQSQADCNAFACSCTVVYTAANVVLYSDTDVTHITGAARSTRDRRRLEGLVLNLSTNAHLASLVKNLKTGVSPEDTLSRLASACTSLRTLQWNISNPGSSNRLLYLQSPNPLPTVWGHLKGFAIRQDAMTAFWPGSLVESLRMASEIDTLSLYVVWQNARQILHVLGPQLRKLKLDLWNCEGLTTSMLESMLSPLFRLKHLYLASFTAKQFREVLLPASLTSLTIENANIVSLQAMCERLSDPDWCPNLQKLPSVKSILRMYRHATSSEEHRNHIEQFIVKIKGAQETCIKRFGWQEESSNPLETLRMRVLMVELDRQIT